MQQEYRRLTEICQTIRKYTTAHPKIAVVLGSGLGGFVQQLRVHTEIAFAQLPHVPISTVPGHAGRLLFGSVGDTEIVLMQGRTHYYEGYSMQQVVRLIRALGMLGVEILLLTNAAGGINMQYHPGEFMLLSGQIASLVPSPLRGVNMEELGPRFPDMTNIYDDMLQKIALDAAHRLHITLHQGVYIQTAGPQYESPQEILMYRTWGADAVGMSTAAEAIAARHMGMRVCGISCISNLAAGLGSMPLSHSEVQQTADRSAADFARLLDALISDFSKTVQTK